ncbi:DUF4301 family protein [Limibacter armeniacum]|uniref:DUF4301 family protein n=1 Tax=Limibacter armeniacum TaxID=466084 RepID=UPI002FE61619
MTEDMTLTNKDQQLIDNKGINLSAIENQIAYFKKGFPSMDVIKPATVCDGVFQLTETQNLTYEASFEDSVGSRKIVKFVPASGAATRMFKLAYGFLRKHQGTEVDTVSFKPTEEDHDILVLFDRIKEFAFYNDLKGILVRKGKDLDALVAKRAYVEMLEALLEDDGMEYGSLPKGLLKFHKYGNQEMRTPVEEHLVEGAMYARNEDRSVNIHFTVSPEHLRKFEYHIAIVKEKYEQRFRTQYHISYSQQKPATDTIAVTMGNDPFRKEDGELLFRPGGHGALLENLNDLDADIIFIKNIDNVQPDRLKPTVELHKKILGGLLIEFQEKIFALLHDLKDKDTDKEKLLQEVEALYTKDLCTIFPEAYHSWDLEKKLSYVYGKLNRPIRVCGMVRNEGEPGGGPFWATNSDGSVSLQIVESAQINLDDPTKKALVDQATHFNPVDIVCATKDYQGNKFNLLDFRDPETGFIAIKSRNGVEVKSQELPGLWNGSMSDWNTIFVEVPASTFSPVKKVNDLLRRSHMTKDQLMQNI